MSNSKKNNAMEYILEDYQENLCNKCPASIRGKCCYSNSNIIDNNLFHWKISLSRHPCKYLNTKTGRCKIYNKRHEINPNCLTIKEMILCGTVSKKCLYVKNNPKYQKRNDTVLLKPPDHISDYVKKKYKELNNSPHCKIKTYETKRSFICPECNSANLTEEWDDKFSILFFKYKCNECGYKWNTFYDQVIWSYSQIKKEREKKTKTMKEKEWNYVYKSDSIGLAQIIQDTRNKLIIEFLRDWRWGMGWRKHCTRYSISRKCKCRLVEFWEWFEEKWKKRMNQKCQ